MNARRLSSTTLVSLLALGCLLVFSDVSARAAAVHNYLSQITEVPAGSGATFAGPLGTVDAMTVDSGRLYVAEGSAEGSRLNEFNASSGAFVTQFPHVASLEYLDQAVAVDHASGEIYVGGDERTGSGAHGVVAAFSAAGALQKVWNGADAPGGAFGCFECEGRGGVAVDNSASLGDWAAGDVYVAAPEQSAVYVFKPLAGGGEEYLTQLPDPEPGVPFSHPRGVAVSQFNGDVLVVDGAGVDVFEPTVLNEYALVRRLTETPAGALSNSELAVATDGSNGDIYVADHESSVVNQFSSAGVYLGRLTGTPAGPFGALRSVAVDSESRDVYVGGFSSGEVGAVDIFGPTLLVPDVTTEPASNLKAQRATLNGTVNPVEAGAATCRFEWGTSPAFGKLAACEPEGVADGNSPVAVHAALSGLQPDTTYHFRLQAGNAAGTNPGEPSQNQVFTTTGPGIHGESASAVTSSSTTLNAAIDPHGTATSYYFQYGTSASYGSNVPAPPGGSLGAGEGDLSVGVHLQGLAPGTTYHYRVVAIAEPGGEQLTVEGPDHTFATQSADTQVTQVDGRAWEMVSPPNKQGAAILAIGNEQGADIQAAADGSGVTYAGTSSFVANPAGNRALELTQAISLRNAPGSWDTADITTAHNEGASRVLLGNSAEYKLFSSDLSVGLTEPAGETPLPPLPADAERTDYLRMASGEYEPLLTAANVPQGVKFGGPANEARPVHFVSASPDLRHVVLSSPLPLVTPAPPAGIQSLYEWAGGQLQLVSVLPNGEPTEAELGYQGVVVRNAISSDGSRFVWGAFRRVGNREKGHLYMSDLSKHETVQVDAAQGSPESSPAFVYKTASSDGSRVFFSSPSRLTADATASSGREDLYVFALTSTGGEPLAGRLTDLTVDRNAGEGADVLGVIGASKDGSYVYFVANGVLGDGTQKGAKRGNCQYAPEPSEPAAAATMCNLYVSHYDAGTNAWVPPTFIAPLSGTDDPSWGIKANQTYLAKMTARVSPNGRYLAFMSARSLTGYDNHDANSNAPDEEVYHYDANTQQLICASCNPTGARPVGLFMELGFHEKLIDYTDGLWRNTWLAGSIPGWTSENINTALYQSRYLSNSGRLFLDSSDALVPADVNGTVDVYEYEPVGVGTCVGPDYGQSASVVFSESLQGCLGLVSAGTSSEESVFMDASETGGDVFFLTLSRLSPRDYDNSLDIYDAHECSSAAPCAPPAALAPAPCTTGDACKPGPTPQPALFGATASETFSGAGNVAPAVAGKTPTQRSATPAQKLARALKKCRKGPKRARAGCERKARRQYRASRARVQKSLSARTRR